MTRGPDSGPRMGCVVARSAGRPIKVAFDDGAPLMLPGGFLLIVDSRTCETIAAYADGEWASLTVYPSTEGR